METLAYLYGSVEYEDPNPAPELRSPKELAKLSNSAVMGLVGSAVIAGTFADIPAAMAVVRRGDNCAAVGDVQRALTNKAFYTGPIDSVFGSATEDAVKRFQRTKGLPVDGTVGTLTADALGLGDAENPNSPFLPGNTCSTTTTPPSTGQETSGVVRTSSGNGIATRSTPNGTRTGSGFADGATVFFNPTTVTSSGGFDWVKVTRGSNNGLWVARNFVGGTGTTPPGTGQEASGVVRTSSGSGIATRSTPNGTRTGSGFADGSTVFFDITSRTASGGFTWVRVTRGSNNGLWVAESFLNGSGNPGPGNPGTGQEASGVVRTSSGSGIATRSTPNGTRTGSGFADGSTVFFDITSRTASGGFTWVRVTRGSNNGLWVAESFLNGSGNPGPGNPGTGQEASGVVRTSSGNGIATRSTPNGTASGSGFADGSTVFFDITSRTASGGFTWVRVTRGSNNGLWVAESFLNGSGNPGPGNPGTGQEASGVVRTSSGSGIATRSTPNGTASGSGFADGSTVFFDITSRTASGGFTWVRVTRGSNNGLWVAESFLNGSGNPGPGNPGTGQEASGVVRTSSGSGIATRTSPNGTASGSGFADGSTVFFDITSRSPTEGFTWVRVTRGSNSGLWVAENFISR